MATTVHLQVTRLTTIVSQVALTRNAPYLAHNEKGRLATAFCLLLYILICILYGLVIVSAIKVTLPVAENKEPVTLAPESTAMVT